MNIHKFLEDQNLILTTEIPIGGAWLLPDGYFLDLDLNYKEGRCENNIYKTGIHATIDHIIKTPLIDNGLIDSVQCGRQNLLTEWFSCIKLQDGLTLKFERPYIMFPKEKLTDQQFNQLELWLYHIAKNASKHFIDIFFAEDRSRSQMNISLNDELGFLTPNDIIKEIKRFYNIVENQSYESAIRQFVERW